MKRFEDAFLVEMGIERLGERSRRKFIATMENELEHMVGRRLDEKLTEWQIAEFEEIIEGNTPRNHKWLRSHFSSYRTTAVYLALKKNGLNGNKIINEAASILWLEENYPDYKNLVKTCADEFCKEMLTYKDLIFEE